MQKYRFNDGPQYAYKETAHQKALSQNRNGLINLVHLFFTYLIL